MVAAIDQYGHRAANVSPSLVSDERTQRGFCCADTTGSANLWQRQLGGPGHGRAGQWQQFRQRPRRGDQRRSDGRSITSTIGNLASAAFGSCWPFFMGAPSRLPFAGRNDRQQLLIAHLYRTAVLIRIAANELRRFAVGSIQNGVGGRDASGGRRLRALA